MIKGIIFDFDGVVVESVQVKTEAFATLYAPYGEQLVKKVVQHHLENGGMSRFEKFKIYHESFLKIILTNNELIELSNKFSKLVVQKVINADYVPGVLSFIRASFETKSLFVSTGTPEVEINEILDAKNLSKYFTKVYGSPDKKETHIKNIMINHGLKSKELVFYGDSYSDLYAAKAFKIPFILVRNKFNKNLVDFYDGKIINDFKGIR